jgi:hypothetical protein
MIIAYKSYAIHNGTNRHQSCFSTLDNEVTPVNTVRLMDGFVDKMSLPKLRYQTAMPKSENIDVIYSVVKIRSIGISPFVLGN